MATKTRGQRDAKDIIDAALAQGWRTRQAGAHLRLIPPNSGVPVGISSTPSDVNFRRQIIRLMRRSGFIWPWPPQEASNGKDKKKMTDTMVGRRRSREMIRELTSPLPFCSENGCVLQQDHKGPCRTLNDQENDSMTTTLAPTTDTTNGAAPPLWRAAVVTPDIVTGYEVSRDGEVKAPTGKILTPQLLGNQLWVALRRSDKEAWVSRTCRVDRLVLEAFGQLPATDKDMPIHQDGDNLNCALSNLAWGPAGAASSTSPPKTPKAKAPKPEKKPEKKVSPLDLAIEDLDLSVRTYNVLRRQGIDTVREIVLCSAEDLREMQGVREHTITEIQGKLADLGLLLPEADPEEKKETSPLDESGHWEELEGEPGAGGRWVSEADIAEPAPRLWDNPAFGAPVGGDEVQELRLYRYHGVEVTVQPGVDPVLPTVTTVAQVRALSKILDHIGL